MSLLSSPPTSPPQQFSTLDGTIQGVIDGVNPYFTIAFPIKRAQVSRNGQQLTLGYDCTFGTLSVVFYGLQIPQPGDVITIEGWI